jgi:hypothetical protein
MYHLSQPKSLIGRNFCLSGMISHWFTHVYTFHFIRRFNSKPEYHEYRQKTSILIPLPHFIYGNTPDIVKGMDTNQI